MSDHIQANTQKNIQEGYIEAVKRLHSNLRTGLERLEGILDGYDFEKTSDRPVAFEPHVEDRFRDSERGFKASFLIVESLAQLLLNHVQEHGNMQQRVSQADQTVMALTMQMNAIWNLTRDKLQISEDEYVASMKAEQDKYTQMVKEIMDAEQKRQEDLRRPDSGLVSPSGAKLSLVK